MVEPGFGRSRFEYSFSYRSFLGNLGPGTHGLTYGFCDNMEEGRMTF